jgi:hypothetical protein
VYGDYYADEHGYMVGHLREKKYMAIYRSSLYGPNICFVSCIGFVVRVTCFGVRDRYIVRHCVVSLGSLVRLLVYLQILLTAY